MGEGLHVVHQHDGTVADLLEHVVSSGAASCPSLPSRKPARLREGRPTALAILKLTARFGGWKNLGLVPVYF